MKMSQAVLALVLVAVFCGCATIRETRVDHYPAAIRKGYVRIFQDGASTVFLSPYVFSIPLFEMTTGVGVPIGRLNASSPYYVDLGVVIAKPPGIYRFKANWGTALPIEVKVDPDVLAVVVLNVGEQCAHGDSVNPSAYGPEYCSFSSEARAVSGLRSPSWLQRLACAEAIGHMKAISSGLNELARLAKQDECRFVRAVAGRALEQIQSGSPR